MTTWTLETMMRMNCMKWSFSLHHRIDSDIPSTPRSVPPHTQVLWGSSIYKPPWALVISLLYVAVLTSSKVHNLLEWRRQYEPWIRCADAAARPCRHSLSSSDSIVAWVFTPGYHWNLACRQETRTRGITHFRNNDLGWKVRVLLDFYPGEVRKSIPKSMSSNRHDKLPST